MDLDNIQRKYGLPAPLPVVQNGKFAPRFPLNLEHRGDDVFQFGGKYIGEIENIYDLLYKILTNQEIDASLSLPYAIKITEDKFYIRDKTNSEWITMFDITKPNFPKEIELYELIYKAITHQVIGEDTSYPGQFKIEENILYVRDKDNLTWTQIGDVTKEFLGATEATQAILEQVNDILTEVQELKTELNRQIAMTNETLTIALQASNEAMTSAQSINIRTFANVEEMKASNTLKAGAFVKTQGFYTYDDGGSADYIIVNDIGEDEIDEVSIMVLQNGLYAKLLIPKQNYVNVKSFGAKFDGVTDDTEAIQKAFNFCNYGGTVIFPALQEAVITKTIIVPIGVSIQANKSYLKTDVNIGWFIKYAKENSSPSGNSTKNTGFSIKCEFVDLGLKGNTTYVNNGIDAYNNLYIYNLATRYLNTSVNKNGSYTDFLQIKGIAVSHKVDDDYAIKFNLLGDGNTIEDAHIFNSDKLNFIEVGYGLQPVSVRNIINGNIYVHDCVCKLEKLHIEKGNIKIGENTLINIDTAHIWKETNNPIINVQNSFIGLTLSNIYSVYRHDREYKDDDCIDVNFYGSGGNAFNCVLKNCYKKLEGKNINTLFVYGIKTNRDGFNRNRTTLSKFCINNGNTFTTPLPNIDIKMPYYVIIGTIFSDPNFKWNEDLTSVSYQGTLLFNEDRKLAYLDKTNTISNVSVNKGGNSVGINLNTFINSPIILIRNGNQKVIVAPIKNNILDTGYMCGGELWETYTSALEIDYQNCYGIEYNPQLNRDNIIAYMDNIPTKGSWLEGDIVKKRNADGGSVFSWICTDTGAPGTWKSLTTIQS